MYTNGVRGLDQFDYKQFFKQRIKENYKLTRQERGGKQFTTVEIIHSFYKTGLQILEYFRKHRSQYFKYTGWQLIGTQVQLLTPISQGVFFKGYIDVVMKQKKQNIIKIIDFKTSQRGWKDNQKKDQLKKAQILLYKKFYSQQYGVDMDKIQVQFIILKKQILKYEQFTIPRIQKFSPANKKPSIKKAQNLLDTFIKQCIRDGQFIKDEANYPTSKLAAACRYCPYYHSNVISQEAKICPRWENKYKKEVING